MSNELSDVTTNIISESNSTLKNKQEKELISKKIFENIKVKNFLDCFISMESLFSVMIAGLLYMIMNFVYMFGMHVNGAINFILGNIDLANYQMDYYNFFLSDISLIYKFGFCLFAFCFIVSQILLIKKKKFSILSFLIYLGIYGYMIYCLWGYSRNLNLFLL